MSNIHRPLLQKASLFIFIQRQLQEGSSMKAWKIALATFGFDIGTMWPAPRTWRKQITILVFFHQPTNDKSEIEQNWPIIAMTSSFWKDLNQDNNDHKVREPPSLTKPACSHLLSIQLGENNEEILIEGNNCAWGPWTMITNWVDIIEKIIRRSLS